MVMVKDLLDWMIEQDSIYGIWDIFSMLPMAVHCWGWDNGS